MARQNRSSQGTTTNTTKGMTIKAKVFELRDPIKTLEALASFTFGFNGTDLFVVKDIKVFYGKNGYFLGMPSKKNRDNEYEDLAFPLSKDFREKLLELTLAAWDDKSGQAEITLE